MKNKIIIFISLFLVNFSYGCEIKNENVVATSPQNKISKSVKNDTYLDKNTSAYTLQTNTWKLKSIKGYDNYKNKYQKFYILFKNKRIIAKAFNSFNAEVVIDKNTIKVKSMIGTKMGLIDKNLTNLEKDYKLRIAQAKKYFISEKDELYLGEGNSRLIFTKINKSAKNR